MSRYFRVGFLVLCVLVWSSLAVECDWDQSIDPEQGVDLGSKGVEVLQLDVPEGVTTLESCLAACCGQPGCGLALVGYPADGRPQCQLVSCGDPGQDACVLQPSSQFKVYRKTVRREAADAKPHITLLKNLQEPPSNEKNNIRCRLPMKIGSCRAAFPKFYYDVTNQSCRSFIYGGCEANANNFESQEACEAACNGVTGSVLPDESTPAPPQNQSFNTNVSKDAKGFVAAAGSVWLQKKDQCMVTPDPGPCRAAFTKFFYDHDTDTCQTFVFGGCRGNQNRYDTAEQCMNRCSKGSVLPDESTPTPPQDQSFNPMMSADQYAESCEVEPQVGPCKAAFQHWYYNSKTKTCESFTFGGCRGNKNNYISKESCMETCSVSILPSSKRSSADDDEYKYQCMVTPDPGPCRAAFTKFFYNHDTDTCQMFVFGGCQGNQNRYDTLEDCMNRCSKGGSFESHGKTRNIWFSVTLAALSALLLVTLVLISLRRRRLSRRLSSVSDKEELLPDLDEQSSVESLTAPESPKPDKA